MKKFKKRLQRIGRIIRDLNSLTKIRYHAKALINDYYHKRFDGRVAQVKYPPKFVTIGIHGYCTFQCLFCVCHCPDAKGNHQHKLAYQMAYPEFTKIVDMAYEAGVPHVHICALGEPLLHKDFFKMLDYVIEKYYYVSVQTDFVKEVFEKKNVLDELLARKDHIEYITTDLFPPSMHNKIKKGSDYDYVLDCLERLSQNTNIEFRIHHILSKSSYKDIDILLKDLVKRRINFVYDTVHLQALGFNAFTDEQNLFLSTDKEIVREIEKIKKLAQEMNVEINLPVPWDEMRKCPKDGCLNLWTRFQVMPSKKVPKDKWIGNVITSQCIAEVMGNMFSLGNLFDYKDLMSFWNNPFLMKARENMIKGVYPDELCKKCFNYYDKE